ncbi:MAG: Hint domain-containing protein, partial [Paracoccaceae bacterium]
SSRVQAQGKYAPVRFAKGAIGNEGPLAVSPQHRVVVSGWKAEMMTGDAEVLVAAIDLVNGGDITQRNEGEIEYFHLMFDVHQIIYANGAACESLFVGQQGLSWLSAAARRELSALFPDLMKNPAGFGEASRRCLKAHEVLLLA